LSCIFVQLSQTAAVIMHVALIYRLCLNATAPNPDV